MSPGGHRPPWWPENEPFPPEGRPEWARHWGRGPWPGPRRMPARVARRMGIYFIAFTVVLTAAGTLAVWLVENVVGGNGAGPPLRVGSAVLLLLALLLVRSGGLLLRRVTRPVDELVDAAGRIEGGDLSVRVAERGPGEVRAVARAFNAMSAELQASDARRRQFLADVSHELRTPLSVIRGRAEGIIDGVYPGDPAHVGPVLDAARTMELLIEDLTTLAVTEAGGLALHRETLDIGVLVNETVGMFAVGAAARGVDLRAEVRDPLPPIEGDPARLQSVLGNLVTNALRHTPGGGSVRVGATARDGAVEVSVVDTGEGIPAEVLPHVFDRFVKGEGSTGSGLGLAIARDLVVAHGGTIRAEAGEGGGTAMRFTIPAPPGD